MRLSTEARVGLFFILGLGLLLVVWEMVGKEGLFARGFMLRGRFERVTGLKVGDPVKLAGVDVGTVTALEPMDDKVEVRMRIAQGTQIREDSVASIRFTSLLGGVHLDITLGTPAAPLLSPDSEITTAETGDLFGTVTQQVGQVTAGIQNLTRSFNENQDRVFRQLSEILDENRATLQATLTNLEKISARLEQGEGTLGKLLVDDTVYTELKRATAVLADLGEKLDRGQGTIGRLINDDSIYESLKRTTDHLGAITAKIERGEGTLGKLVQDDGLYRDARGTLASLKEFADRVGSAEGTLGKLMRDESLYIEVAEAAKRLNAILTKIERGEGTLGKLVQDDSLFFAAKDSLKKVGRTADQFRDQSTVGVIGSAVGVLF